MSRTASDQANRAAVDWLLKLESSSQGDAVQQAFAHWLAQSGEHAAAWQRVNAVLSQPLVGLRPTILLKPAGTRPDPAVSVPSENATRPRATTEAEPELEPPLM